MSAARSGGVDSSAVITASQMACIGSARASATCAWLTSVSLGTPFRRSRPRMVITSPRPSSGIRAVPISFLIRSAVASPISRLCCRRR